MIIYIIHKLITFIQYLNEHLVFFLKGLISYEFTNHQFSNIWTN